MRISIVGAGPAGLYLAYLLKKRGTADEVQVFEQNTADATFGFGVVFSDRALEFLREDDPETYDAITPEMESWSDMTLDLEGRVVRIDGIGFSAIGRLQLLQRLQARARSVGVRLQFQRTVGSLDELRDADLLVGADGVNSLVRETYATELGASVGYLTNKFVWYGTTKVFKTLTQSFRRCSAGAMNAHHYRYSPQMSTFIVETDSATWERAGFASMDEQSTKTYLERVFEDVLDGHGLVSNKSVWRSFPQIRNERWFVKNAVLIGDALHTAHFSIGSGTRLAMEDAIALSRAVEDTPDDVAGAMRAYESTRRPILEKLTAAANASADWYARFSKHMRLPPLEFAMSYITRSGRVDLERLRKVSPRFVAEYEAFSQRNKP